MPLVFLCSLTKASLLYVFLNIGLMLYCVLILLCGVRWQMRFYFLHAFDIILLIRHRALLVFLHSIEQYSDAFI